MSNKYLIIGATGAIGHAFARALQESGQGATLLVRNRKKALDLFGDTTGFIIVEGDANDTRLLKQIAEGTEFIFHGGNAPYQHWRRDMPLMTRSIIDAAEHVGATVIFPGNNYNYGQIDQPISEITPFNPCSALGKLRVDLEQQLQQATDQGRIRTLVVRMAEIWGPNVTNKQFAPVFENVAKGKAMPWLVSVDTPQQLLYAPDAGRAMVALTRQKELGPYEVFNLGGTRVASIRSWLEQVADVADRPAKISVLPRFMLRMLGRVSPIMREVASLAYKFDTSVLLNDDRFKEVHPEFKQTPMPQAIAETLMWFKKNGSDSAGQRKNRRKARVDAAVRFTVDNIAIGVFPAILLTAATQLPVIESFVPYMLVAAGIYWTPGLHGLSDKLRMKRSGNV